MKHSTFLIVLHTSSSLIYQAKANTHMSLEYESAIKNCVALINIEIQNFSTTKKCREDLLRVIVLILAYDGRNHDGAGGKLSLFLQVWCYQIGSDRFSEK